MNWKGDLDDATLSPSEKEQLTIMFVGMDKIVEEFGRDPQLAHQFLERIGYFKAMEDERLEKEKLAHSLSEKAET